MKKAKGQRDPERTREQLIDAATRLFAAHGFDGATAEQIASAAGVNKAMINYHFGGKEGLYEAILGGIIGAAATRLEGLRTGPQGAPEKLAAYIDIFADLHREHPALSHIMAREMLSGGRFISLAVMPQFLSIFSTVASIVAQGAREGVFRPADPLLTHLGVMGPMVLFFISAPMRARLTAEGRLPFTTPTPEQFVEHMKAMTLGALRRTGPEQP